LASEEWVLLARDDEEHLEHLLVECDPVEPRSHGASSRRGDQEWPDKLECLQEDSVYTRRRSCVTVPLHLQQHRDMSRLRCGQGTGRGTTRLSASSHIACGTTTEGRSLADSQLRGGRLAGGLDRQPSGATSCWRVRHRACPNTSRRSPLTGPGPMFGLGCHVYIQTGTSTGRRSVMRLPPRITHLLRSPLNWAGRRRENFVNQPTDNTDHGKSL
jgi:hypothetical protein